MIAPDDQRVVTTTDRTFRVLRGQSRVPRAERDTWPASLPWSVVEPWRGRAEENHSQTLERLDERGGLAPEELWLAAHDKGLRGIHEITESAAGQWLILVAALGLTWEQVRTRSALTMPSGLEVFCADCSMQYEARGVPCLAHTLESERPARARIVGLVA